MKIPKPNKSAIASLVNDCSFPRLDLSLQQVQDHLLSSVPSSVEEIDVVQRARERLDQAERNHARDAALRQFQREAFQLILTDCSLLHPVLITGVEDTLVDVVGVGESLLT